MNVLLEYIDHLTTDTKQSGYRYQYVSARVNNVISESLARI